MHVGDEERFLVIRDPLRIVQPLGEGLDLAVDDLRDATVAVLLFLAQFGDVNLSAGPDDDRFGIFQTCHHRLRFDGVRRAAGEQRKKRKQNSMAYGHVLRVLGGMSGDCVTTVVITIRPATGKNSPRGAARGYIRAHATQDFRFLMPLRRAYVDDASATRFLRVRHGRDIVCSRSGEKRRH
ncbi:MAG: hypothetical protein QM811_09635 [Pirellulales bacterium]